MATVVSVIPATNARTADMLRWVTMSVKRTAGPLRKRLTVCSQADPRAGALAPASRAGVAPAGRRDYALAQPAGDAKLQFFSVFFSATAPYRPRRQVRPVCDGTES